jgi:hypothetical protein
MNILNFSSSLVLTTLMTISGIVTTITPSHAAPSPFKGMLCTQRGFQLDIFNGIVRCQLKTSVLIENSCLNPAFPKLNFMVGRDVCSKSNTTIAANGGLNGLVINQDYVFSVPNPDARRAAELRLEQGFVLGTILPPNLPGVNRPSITVPRIPVGERDARFAGQRVLVDDNPGIDDHTKVFFDVYMFPEKAQ